MFTAYVEAILVNLFYFYYYHLINVSSLSNKYSSHIASPSTCMFKELSFVHLILSYWITCFKDFDTLMVLVEKI